MEDIRDAMLVGRNSEGKRVERPLSPHVDIYRWKITMAQSILHRITGVALAGGALLLVIWLASVAAGGECFTMVQSLLGSVPGLVILAGFTLALFYHLAAGLRHLAWDCGWGFEKHQFNATSVWIFAFAALATLFVLAAGFYLVQG